MPIRVTANLSLRIDRCRKRDNIEPDITKWENDSETGADNFKYYEIINNKDFVILYKQIDKFINKLINKKYK